MTAESDELLFMVRRFVADRVEPPLQAVVTEAIVRTLVVMMAEPRFYSQLAVVRSLQEENSLLRMQLANVTAVLARYQPVKVPAKKRTAKKSAAKRRPVATNPPVAVKRAFKQGQRGR